MKTTLTTLLLIVSISLMAQTRLSLTQDAKLATVGDDIGNSAFTPNLNFRASQYIAGDRFFNVLAFAEYEYADLTGGAYNRAGIGLGLNFDNWIKNFEFSAFYGINQIFRHNETFSGWDLTGQLAYNINPTFAIITELQQTKRSDLKRQPFIYSFRAGLRITIFN